MGQQLISVIVPVYKVEKYLDKCISSIVNQTYKNLEIILVDDGSPDKCPLMCDEWAKRDSRIKVVHKENGGAGQARNVGLKIANGELIAFVDSDDYISKYMYEYLVGILQQDIDIAECELYSAESDDVSLDDLSATDKLTLCSKTEAMRGNIKDKIFRQLIWNKLYKKEALEGVFFPEGKMIDDEFWTYRVIGNANKLVHSDKKMYVYRQHTESVMHSMTPEKRLQAIEAKYNRHVYLKSVMEELVPESSVNIWFTCMYNLQKILSCKNIDDKLEIEREINRYLKKIDVNIRQVEGIKQKMWLLLSKISMKNTCRLRNCLKIGI